MWDLYSKSFILNWKSWIIVSTDDEGNFTKIILLNKYYLSRYRSSV